jgi:hypothetical protein
LLNNHCRNNGRQIKGADLIKLGYLTGKKYYENSAQKYINRDGYFSTFNINGTKDTTIGIF